MNSHPAPYVGAVVALTIAGQPERFALIAGPFSPGAPGEEWFGAPLLPLVGEPAADEMAIASMPFFVAAAWASTSISAASIGAVVETLSEDEVDDLHGRVLAVDDGRISTPAGSESQREAAIRRWVTVDIAPPSVSQVLGAYRFLNQIEFFVDAAMNRVVSSEMLVEFEGLQLPDAMIVRSPVYSPDRSWLPSGAHSTLQVPQRKISLAGRSFARAS